MVERAFSKLEVSSSNLLWSSDTFASMYRSSSPEAPGASDGAWVRLIFFSVM